MSYSCVDYSTNFSANVADGYYVYLVDCSSNSVTVTLDDIQYNDGVAWLFIRTDSNTGNNLTLTCSNSQLIDGNSSLSITVADKSYELISYAGNWVSHK